MSRVQRLSGGLRMCWIYRSTREVSTQCSVSVWCAPEQNPWVSALVAGLGRFLSAEAAEAMAAPSRFGHADRLGQLFHDAGFASVQGDTTEIARLLPATTAGLEHNLLTTPLAAWVLAMDAGERAEMVDQMLSELDDYRQDDQLSVPARSNVVNATA